MGVLLHDGWHSLTHVDSRLWRTLVAPPALRRFYGQNRRFTLLKAIPIVVGYSVCLLLMMAVTMVYSALVI
jgi:hypothetical protein